MLSKFEQVDKQFHQNINEIFAGDNGKIDLIHHFPIYTGHVNLARYLFFYDLFKQITHLSGHIADVGVWRGDSFFYFAKLIKLFEPYSQTQVHGFDWFKGMEPSEDDNLKHAGKYAASYTEILRLIQLQNLDSIAIIHNMDLTTELKTFDNQNPSLRFKLVFIDCGITKVLEPSLEFFWRRLVKNGILIMDHFNNKSSPSESRLIETAIQNNVIRQVPYTRQPTAFVIKEQ